MHGKVIFYDYKLTYISPTEQHVPTETTTDCIFASLIVSPFSWFLAVCLNPSQWALKHVHR